MTKEEAIKIIKGYLALDNDIDSEYLEAQKVVIEALERETCEDAIDRQKAIRLVKTECNPYGKPTIDFESGKRVITLLEQMSPVMVIPTQKSFPNRLSITIGADKGE